jgi:hypothetical protein
MRRSRHDVFAKAATARYIVQWSIHWQAIEVEHVRPGTDLRDALAALIKQLKSDGWQVEEDASYGFAFINRGDERRLLALTERDPADTRPQSFRPG